MAAPTSPARASATAVAGVLAAVGLMLLLVTWAATIGPQEVVTRPGHAPSYASTSPSTPTSTPDGPTSNQRGSGADDHDLLLTAVSLAATLMAAVLMLAVALFAVRWLLTRNWHRRREPEPEPVDFDPLDSPAALAGTLFADAPRQRELLTTGSPRNAIVAAWHAFEERAEAAGVRRRPWETSSEFTLRVLDRLSADTGSVVALAELYRDARHSRHEITENNREAALAALDAIHRSLGARVEAR